jgi:hypothetical protein
MIVTVHPLHHMAFRASKGTTFFFYRHFGTAIIIIIIVIINHLYTGCLQLYTWNNVRGVRNVAAIL